jgi:hypothetical protein
MNREVRQVLAELELVSHGKCQSFNASGRPAEGHARPFGDPYPEFIVFRERFDREGYSDRLLQEARDTLATLKRQAVKQDGETLEDLEGRIVEGDRGVIVEGATPQEVADWAKVTVRFVMQARERQGYDPMTGRPMLISFDVLVQRGLSVRQIARVTGMSRMTAHRRMQQVKRLGVAA